MAYKSGKERRAEIMRTRSVRLARKAQEITNVMDEKLKDLARGKIPVNASALRPHNSYGLSFVLRGYYEDETFHCTDCGAKSVWAAKAQRWWYEEIKGNVYAMPVRCASCRAKERERKEEARRVSEAGMARKQMKASCLSR